MSCTTAEMSLLLEYIERKQLEKAKQLGIPPEKIKPLIMEIELIKQSLLEQGINKIIRELGV